MIIFNLVSSKFISKPFNKYNLSGILFILSKNTNKNSSYTCINDFFLVKWFDRLVYSKAFKFGVF